MAKQRDTGELEAEVLAVLWAADSPVTPGDVLCEVDGVAYTTVMTILTRLWKKGLATRDRRGRAYAYAPVVSEAQLIAQRMRATLDRTADRRAALSQFVDGLPKRDEETLRKVLSSLDAKR